MPIEQISLSPAASVAELWREAALRTRNWLQSHGLNPRDAIVLLPYAALMAPARAAWSALGGWQPRIETPLTLAGSLGPPQPTPPGACSGDATQDAITARLMLLGQPWAAAWDAHDAPGFAAIVDSVVTAARTLRDAALTRDPAVREAFWSTLREGMPAPVGPSAVESALLQTAIEWAAISASAGTDRLFALRPSAWIALRMGGAFPAAEALLDHTGIPSLLLQADPPDEAPFDAIAASPAAGIDRIVCEDFESEAQAAAAQVIAALNAGRTPVALVVLDRELMRRVRALLQRRQVPVVDETGWLLATTRAAAAVVALLRAARRHAGDDALLDWLKTWPPARPNGSSRALDALEARLRGRPVLRDGAAADALLAAAQAHLKPLADAGTQSLAAWLQLLGDCLHESGSLDLWLQDDAGAQVLAALGIAQAAPWQPLAPGLPLSLAGFTDWVERTLQAQPFLPLPDVGAQVVLMPLARSFGRPFAQVVMPAADDVRLGAIEPPPALISERWAAESGLETAALRRLRQRLALAQVLRAPRVTLLRRLRDDDAPVAESPEIEWLLLARERAAPDLPAWPERRWQPALAEVPLQPVSPPLPTAAGSLPARLSASRLQALRDCPYRFYSRAVLRLDEAEELQTELAKRDYGTWLHAVLHRFHSQRQPGEPAGVALMAAADAVTDEQQLSAAELLPFRASFDNFAPAYLQWLAEREEAGWTWREGEVRHEMPLPAWPQLKLVGVIDRVDAGPAAAMQLLDYKTSYGDELKRRVAQPLEDTQLAFYAALLGAGPGLQAAYVTLDDPKAPETVAHPDVSDTAQQMMEELAGEWQRLLQGAALPALGEGSVCATCEARGLCRRDHWGQR